MDSEKVSAFLPNYVNSSIQHDKSILVTNLTNLVRKNQEAESWSLGRLVCDTDSNRNVCVEKSGSRPRAKFV